LHVVVVVAAAVGRFVVVRGRRWLVVGVRRAIRGIFRRIAARAVAVATFFISLFSWTMSMICLTCWYR